MRHWRIKLALFKVAFHADQSWRKKSSNLRSLASDSSKHLSTNHSKRYREKNPESLLSPCVTSVSPCVMSCPHATTPSLVDPKTWSMLSEHTAHHCWFWRLCVGSATTTQQCLHPQGHVTTSLLETVPPFRSCCGKEHCGGQHAAAFQCS